MLKIRPHHILCMKAYIGKGYSQNFNENMEKIINTLKENVNQQVEVVFGLDDVCSKCPNNMGNGLCKSQDKVESIDLKVSKHFKIKKGKYMYKDLQYKVYSNINEDKFMDICKSCEWYYITNCKDLNFKK